MKLLFVAQNLQMGGIQKALVNQLKEINNEPYKIELFTFGGGPLLNEVPNNIKIHHGHLLLNLISTPFATVKKSKNYLHLILRILCMIIVRIVRPEKFYQLLFKIQKKIGNYDVAISYFNDIPNGYFNRGTNQFVINHIKSKKKFAWIHTDPLKANFKYDECKKTYKKFDRIICVSEACRENFIEFLPDYKHKVGVVYNFFPIEEIKEKSNKITRNRLGDIIHLVSVGRIDNKTKRFHLIPQISKLMISSGVTNFYWTIVGNGPDIIKNKQLVTELEVEDHVEFIGERANPYSTIKKSSLFILISEYEGFPMVIGEALILETPVLTTRYAAVNEQIREEFNGLVVDNDIDSIVLGLSKILKNPHLIDLYARNLREHPYSNSVAHTQFRYEVGDNNG